MINGVLVLVLIIRKQEFVIIANTMFQNLSLSRVNLVARTFFLLDLTPDAPAGQSLGSLIFFFVEDKTLVHV